MKFLSGLLAFISSLYAGESQYNKSLPPLNTAIISYSETYFAPAVAEPGNFPRAKTIASNKSENAKISETPSVIFVPNTVLAPVLPPLPPVPVVVLLQTEPEDPYLPKIEPITDWLSANLSFIGKSSEGDRTLPELTFDREYWRMEVLSYWAPNVTPPKPTLEKDYVKIEVYEVGTSKLIYTMASGNDEAMHKYQIFKKAGKYYFKVYSKSPSQWEITFTVSPKLAK